MEFTKEQVVEIIRVTQGYFQQSDYADLQTFLADNSPVVGQDTSSKVIEETGKKIRNFISNISPMNQEAFKRHNNAVYNIYVELLKDSNNLKAFSTALFDTYHAFNTVRETQTVLSQVFQNPQTSASLSPNARSDYANTQKSLMSQNYAAYASSLVGVFNNLKDQDFNAINSNFAAFGDNAKNLYRIPLLKNKENLEQFIVDSLLFSDVQESYNFVKNNKSTLSVIVGTMEEPAPVVEPKPAVQDDSDEKLTTAFNTVNSVLSRQSTNNTLSDSENRVLFQDAKTILPAAQALVQTFDLPAGVDGDQLAANIAAMAIRTIKLNKVLDDNLSGNGIDETTRVTMLAQLIKYFDDDRLGEAFKYWVEEQSQNLSDASEDKQNSARSALTAQSEQFNAILVTIGVQLGKELLKQIAPQIKSFIVSQMSPGFKTVYDRLELTSFDDTRSLDKTFSVDGDGFWSQVGNFFLQAIYFAILIGIDLLIDEIAGNEKGLGFNLDESETKGVSAFNTVERNDATEAITTIMMVNEAQKIHSQNKHMAHRRNVSARRVINREDYEFEGITTKDNRKPFAVKLDKYQTYWKKNKDGTDELVVKTVSKTEAGHKKILHITYNGRHIVQKEEIYDEGKLINKDSTVINYDKSGFHVANDNMDVKLTRTTNHFVKIADNLPKELLSSLEGKQAVRIEFDSRLGFKDSGLYKLNANKKFEQFALKGNQFIIQASKLKSLYVTSDMHLKLTKLEGYQVDYKIDLKNEVVVKSSDNTMAKQSLIQHIPASWKASQRVMLDIHGSSDNFIAYELQNGKMMPMTLKDDTVYSASALRKLHLRGNYNLSLQTVDGKIFKIFDASIPQGQQALYRTRNKTYHLNYRTENLNIAQQ